MRKIRLDVDRLAVDSFATAERDARTRGTVDGHHTGGTRCETYCGRECPSGPLPCETSRAWTNGVAVCVCEQSIENCTAVDCAF